MLVAASAVGGVSRWWKNLGNFCFELFFGRAVYNKVEIGFAGCWLFSTLLLLFARDVCVCIYIY